MVITKSQQKKIDEYLDARDLIEIPEADCEIVPARNRHHGKTQVYLVRYHKRRS